MHGVVLTAFARFATERHGVAPATGFAPGESYPDAALTEMVAAVAREARLSETEVLRTFGRYAGRVAFAELFPEYYAASPDTRTFLLGVEERIHEVVRATVAGAAPPRLSVVPLGAGGVVVGYTSERGLCALLEGVIEGTAEHYGEHFTLSHPACMHHGDAGCSVVVEPASGP